MILTLEVIAPHATQLGAVSRKTFRVAGGVIGRDASNDWVLPHTRVSGRHARISCDNAAFYIEDTSRNGVFLNSTSNRLVKGRPHALKSGDRILIEPYEIQVSIDVESNDADRQAFPQRAQASSPGAEYAVRKSFDPEDDPFEQVRRPSVIPSGSLSKLENLPEPTPGEELDPLKLLDPGPRRQPIRKAPSARDLEGSSPLAAHYQPPPVVTPTPAPSPSGILIPEDYDPLAPDPPPTESMPLSLPTAPIQTVSERAASNPPPTPPPIASVAPVAAGPIDSSEWAAPSGPARRTPAPVASADRSATSLADVLAGAGVDPAAVTPELAASFGQILRVVVSGVMDVLRARHQIKDEFRMRVTHFKVADNNPLKFSANVDDALHNLLVKRNEAYLGPVGAFEDAFDDLRHHQIALLAGMRLAFEFMLGEFDPDRLQDQFDRPIKRSSLPGMPARLRYWDHYRDRWQEMAKDPEVSFRKLFGEAFAKAYEEQLRLLKSRHGGNG